MPSGQATADSMAISSIRVVPVFFLCVCIYLEVVSCRPLRHRQRNNQFHMAYQCQSEEFMNTDTSSPHCMPCSRCPPGTGVKHECHHNHDTECEPCVLGKSYSMQLHSFRLCFPCSVCSHREILRECSETSNGLCGDCDADYFYEQQTHSCMQCSSCYPEFPGYGIRMAGCVDQPHDIQCYPMPRPYTGGNYLSYDDYSDSNEYVHMDDGIQRTLGILPSTNADMDNGSPLPSLKEANNVSKDQNVGHEAVSGFDGSHRQTGTKEASGSTGNSTGKNISVPVGMRPEEESESTISLASSLLRVGMDELDKERQELYTNYERITNVAQRESSGVDQSVALTEDDSTSGNYDDIDQWADDKHIDLDQVINSYDFDDGYYQDPPFNMKEPGANSVNNDGLYLDEVLHPQQGRQDELSHPAYPVAAQFPNVLLLSVASGLFAMIVVLVTATFYCVIKVRRDLYARRCLIYNPLNVINDTNSMDSKDKLLSN